MSASPSPAAVLLATVLLGAPAAALAPSGPYDQAMAALDQGRFHDAAQALQQESDPLLAARGAVELAYRGRDFARAEELAERGLRLAPGDVPLLQRAAASALWLHRAGEATRLTERLSAGVETMPEGVRPPWEELVADYRRRIGEMAAEDAARARSVRRARAVALTGIALSVLAAGALALRPGR